MASIMATVPEVATRHNPLRNFPLPRELRDQIYRYLLKSSDLPDVTRRERKNSNCRLYNARSYKYWAAILRVNKTIGYEAREILYGDNTFMTVSTQHRPLLLELKCLQHPSVLISEPQVLRFRHSSMHVDIKLLTEDPPPCPTTHLVIPWRHIDLFCLILRWLLYTLGPASGEDAHKRDNELWPGTCRGVNIAFMLHRTAFSPQTPGRDIALLNRFKDCISDNSFVTFRNFSCHHSFVSTLHSRMTAEGHSPVATAWHVLDNVMKLVTISQAAYLRGSSEVTLSALRLLLDQEYRRRIEYRIGGNVVAMRQSCHEEVVKRIEIIMLDCHASATYIHMNSGHDDEADDSSRNLWASHWFMRMKANYNALLPLGFGDGVHAVAERGSILSDTIHSKGRWPGRYLTIGEAIQRMRVLHQAVPGYLPVQRDLKMLQALAAQGQVMFGQMGDREKFFVGFLIPTPENTAHAAYNYIVPESLQGWRDMSED